MLDGNIQIFDDLGLFGDDVDEFLIDLIRIKGKCVSYTPVAPAAKGIVEIVGGRGYFQKKNDEDGVARVSRTRDLIIDQCMTEERV